MPQRLSPTWRLALIVLTLIAATAIYIVSFDLFKRSEVARASARLTLYESSLTAALDQYQHLPLILTQDSHVQAGALGRDLNSLNKRLKAFAQASDVDAIYLMQPDGLTIAASNYDQTPTFLGKSYAFRPYFQAALNGASGQFFAIGVTTLKPGYFLSGPVHDDQGTVRGVIAVKVDLSPLAQTWGQTGEDIFVSNADGVVVLASDPTWRYRTLVPLSPENRARIEAGRQFAREALEPLQWRAQDTSAWLGDTSFVHLSQSVGPLTWQVHYLTPKAALRKNAVFVTLGFLALLAVLTGIWLQRRGRRVRAALIASQEDRRKLSRTNQALAQEIDTRRAAELRLEKAQDDLERASKLAALGQLSASVTHELGQPLSAMKTYLTAAELQASPNLGLLTKLGGLVQRMEQITTQLRFFAKPSATPFEIVDLRDVWHSAHELVRHDIKAAKIHLTQDLPGSAVCVEGNRLRLEQVVVNLLKNAVLSIAESQRQPRTIGVTLGPDATLVIRDSGLGLQGKSLKQLQEPFETTRSSGTGMGLGLAISAGIVAEHNGVLTARDLGQGAEFSVSLPTTHTDVSAAQTAAQ
ncbi:sensor histidine kinase [Algirhabdus cladophorae]|uniref:sensor histidine kinase n=1 Tax=Algirhabdus cladophorae TaxID=3377108 RepID=UPI003B84613D